MRTDEFTEEHERADSRRKSLGLPPIACDQSTCAWCGERLGNRAICDEGMWYCDSRCQIDATCGDDAHCDAAAAALADRVATDESIAALRELTVAIRDCLPTRRPDYYQRARLVSAYQQARLVLDRIDAVGGAAKRREPCAQ